MAIAVRGTPTEGNGGSVSVTSVTCNVPTGTLDGDVMVWHISNQTAATIATPAGWNLISTSSTTGLGQGAFYRVASSEPASYTATVASARTSCGMVTFSGVDTVTPLDVAVPAVIAGTTTLTFTAITPVTAGAVALGIGAYTQTGANAVTATSSNLTMDIQYESTATGASLNACGAIGHFAWSSGAFTPNMSPGTTARTIGVTAALRPAAAAATVFPAGPTRRTRPLPAKIRRGRSDRVPAQAVLAPAPYVPETRRRPPKGFAPRRRTRTEVPPSQAVVTPPAKVSDPRRVARGLFPQRRKRVAERIPFAHDNFNRATLTSSWICAGTPVTLDGSAVVGSTAANAERWAYPVTNNSGTVYSQATYKAGHFWAVAVAMPAFAQGDPITGGTWYVFRQQTGTNGCIIGQKDLGLATTTTLASSATNFAANDVIRLEYDGTTLNAYINGSLLLSVNPGSPISLTAQPFAGFSHASASESGVVLLDDWSAGPFAPTPAASVFPFGMGRPWRRPVLPRLGSTAERIQGQVVVAPPAYPASAQRVVRRLAMIRRDRSVEVTPPQIVVTPPTYRSETRRAVRRFVMLPRRDRSVEVVPPQSQPPPETARRRQARGFVARRRSRVEVVPPQIVVAPPPFVPDTRRRATRGFASRRRRSVEVVPPQVVVTPPAYVPTIPAKHNLRGTVRRGRHVAVTPPQQAAPAAPPYVPTIPPRHALRGVPRRGRRADVPQAQAPAHRGQPRRPLRVLGRAVRRAFTRITTPVAPIVGAPQVTLVAAVHDHTLTAAVHDHTLTAATQSRTVTAATHGTTLTASTLDRTIEET